ncbi:MAG: portal protein, partial [Phenylobacterium sp.]
EQTEREILLLSDRNIVGAKEFEQAADLFAMAGIVPVNSRMAKAYKITQRIMTGAEILETNEWQGQYLPIVPVYGEEINIEGKRYFRSLIHNGMDAQRMLNYWRTTATELVALAPRVPFIGEEGAFDADPNWVTANTQSHPFLQYARGSNMPQRQPIDGGTAAGAMSEALAASDDIKSTIGMYDASLGARSNETSGKAILARQREGDVSTFHYIDNLSRAIRHAGRVLIDLIPRVYSAPRMVRILGPDGAPALAAVNGAEGGGSRVFDLSAGRYDLTVRAGPSFASRREEAASQMIELIRASRSPISGAAGG